MKTKKSIVIAVLLCYLFASVSANIARLRLKVSETQHTISSTNSNAAPTPITSNTNSNTATTPKAPLTQITQQKEKTAAEKQLDDIIKKEQQATIQRRLKVLEEAIKGLQSSVDSSVKKNLQIQDTTEKDMDAIIKMKSDAIIEFARQAAKEIIEGKIKLPLSLEEAERAIEAEWERQQQRKS